LAVFAGCLAELFFTPSKDTMGLVVVGELFFLWLLEGRVCRVNVVYDYH
jgi:hypothetical protein